MLAVYLVCVVIVILILITRIVNTQILNLRITPGHKIRIIWKERRRTRSPEPPGVHFALLY